MQCHAATVEVGEVNTVSSISISASVPRVGRKSSTLLHMQWLKRKRAKRIDDVSCTEVVKEEVEVPSHMVHMSSIDNNLTSTALVLLENESPECYVCKELIINSNAPLDPDASV